MSEGRLLKRGFLINKHFLRVTSAFFHVHTVDYLWEGAT